MADVTISEEKLQSLLEKAAASAVEQYHKAQKTKLPEQSEVRAPFKRNVRPEGRFGLVAFDPRTKETHSLGQKAWLWNPGKIHECPCGKVRYADNQQFVGSMSIEEAMRGTVLKDADGQSIVATRPGWKTMDTLPDDLAYTEEKAAHMRECMAANPEHDPAMLRAQYGHKLKEAK